MYYMVSQYWYCSLHLLPSNNVLSQLEDKISAPLHPDKHLHLHNVINYNLHHHQDPDRYHNSIIISQYSDGKEKLISSGWVLLITTMESNS